jgi:hypothetical protein
VRRRVGLELVVDHPVVVRDRDLGRDVILLQAEVRRGHGERVDGLTWREPPELGDVDLDDEAAAGFQVHGNVLEAGDLFVLGREVGDGVAHQVGKPEAAV